MTAKRTSKYSSHVINRHWQLSAHNSHSNAINHLFCSRPNDIILGDQQNTPSITFLPETSAPHKLDFQVNQFATRPERQKNNRRHYVHTRGESFFACVLLLCVSNWRFMNFTTLSNLHHSLRDNPKTTHDAITKKRHAKTSWHATAARTQNTLLCLHTITHLTYVAHDVHVNVRARHAYTAVRSTFINQLQSACDGRPHSAGASKTPMSVCHRWTCYAQIRLGRQTHSACDERTHPRP